MKALHVVPSYLPATRYGGPIYSVHGLCSALARRGLDVEVYTTNVDGPGVSDVPIEEPVEIDGVKVTYYSTGIGRRLYRSPSMDAALTRNATKFDVIHIHSVFLWPTLSAAFAARKYGVPYVLSPRGMLVPSLIRQKSRLLKSAWIRMFERRNVNGASSVHVTAELESRDLLQLLFRPKRIDMIPNGFDLPLEAEVAIRDATFTQGVEPSVLSLGRVNWKKGLDRLIPAMARTPRGRLVIAGNDEESYTPQLDALIALHGIGDRTKIIGPVYGAAKWRTFAGSDIFALASYSENFGIAVLEAMACGLPVVVTPEVGLAKVVEEIGAGIVCNGDPEQFGAALERLIADPELRRAMGERGRKGVADCFSWNSVAAQMESLYGDLCGSQG